MIRPRVQLAREASGFAQHNPTTKSQSFPLHVGIVGKLGLLLHAVSSYKKATPLDPSPLLHSSDKSAWHLVYKIKSR